MNKMLCSSSMEVLSPRCSQGVFLREVVPFPKLEESDGPSIGEQTANYPTIFRRGGTRSETTAIGTAITLSVAHQNDSPNSTSAIARCWCPHGLIFEGRLGTQSGCTCEVDNRCSTPIRDLPVRRRGTHYTRRGKRRSTLSTRFNILKIRLGNDTWEDLHFAVSYQNERRIGSSNGLCWCQGASSGGGESRPPSSTLEGRCGTHSGVTRDVDCDAMTETADCGLTYVTKYDSRKWKCCTHGEDSWEVDRRLEAQLRIHKGRGSIPHRKVGGGSKKMAVVDSTAAPPTSAYLKCNRCRKVVCIDCVRSFAAKLSHFKNQANTPWSKFLHTLLDAKLPHGMSSSHRILLTIPGSVSHCCELRVSKKPPREKHLIKSPSSTAVPVDGVFGLHGFDLAIYPSLVEIDTISLTQMGDRKDASFQAGVFHSVIPNDLAFQYEIDNISPIGVLENTCTFDRTEDVSTLCPIDNTPVTLKVRIICFPRSKVGAKDGLSTRGGCHFHDPDVFRRCVPLFDAKMRDKDRDNNVDVTIILGEPGTNDKGRSYFNLTTRFYKSEYCIPNYGESELNRLNENLFDALPKGGFVSMRRGGSGGLAIPDSDLFAYLATHRGSTPRKAQAVKFIRLRRWVWQIIYISPYKQVGNGGG